MRLAATSYWAKESISRLRTLDASAICAGEGGRLESLKSKDTWLEYHKRASDRRVLTYCKAPNNFWNLGKSSRMPLSN